MTTRHACLIVVMAFVLSGCASRPLQLGARPPAAIPLNPCDWGSISCAQ